jgi:hypothetical protein
MRLGGDASVVAPPVLLVSQATIIYVNENLHDAQEQYHDQDHGQSASAQDGVGRNVNICVPDRNKK